ncbi:hypothetical protein C3F00_027125 [Pseudomonas sp. MWU13-2860]|nr:hypothetical protein C3F00_027125 [Pseudomonas sp. MWU13-2860]
MTADYVGHTALALQLGVERLAWMAHSRRKFICVGEGRFDLCSFGRTPVRRGKSVPQPKTCPLDLKAF